VPDAYRARLDEFFDRVERGFSSSTPPV
jgi:hypothetical protein